MDTPLARRVRARFFLRLEDDPPLVVTAARRAGKTALVCGLAVELARTHGKRVCVVSLSRREALACQRATASPSVWCGCFYDQAFVSALHLADAILVDDVQFVRPDDFFEHIVPWMGVRPVLLIGTLTGNPHNLLSFLCRRDI